MITVDGEPVFNQEQLEKQIKVAEKMKTIAVDFQFYAHKYYEPFYGMRSTEDAILTASELYDKFMTENYEKY